MVLDTQQQLHDELARIDNDPNGVVADRLSHLDSAILSLPARQAKEGRMSMRDHLSQLRQQVAENPDAYLAARRSELERALALIAAPDNRNSDSDSDSAPGA